MKNIDFLSIVFSSIVYIAIYFFWYSDFLFGKIYKKNLKKNKKKKSFFSYFLIFLSIFIICYIVALFEVLLNITTFWDGAFFGSLVWMGFIIPHGIFLVISYKRNFILFLLDSFLYLIGLLAISGIIAG